MHYAHDTGKSHPFFIIFHKRYVVQSEAWGRGLKGMYAFKIMILQPEYSSTYMYPQKTRRLFSVHGSVLCSSMRSKKMKGTWWRSLLRYKFFLKIPAIQIISFSDNSFWRKRVRFGRAVGQMSPPKFWTGS